MEQAQVQGTGGSVASACGMNSLHVGNGSLAGSPAMNRMEGGEAGARQAQGTPTSPTAAAAAGAPGLIQTAPTLVGPAGNLFGTTGGACAGGACGPQMLPAAGYGPMRTGGLMDPRNYGGQGFMNQGPNGNGCGNTGQVFQEQQNQQGTGACGFAWPGGSVGPERFGETSPFAASRAARSQEPMYGVPCVSGQCGSTSQGQSQGQCSQGPGQGQVGACMGPNVGGVTPQNERLQDVLQRMVQLEPMQLLHVKQLLEQNSNQARHVPETFGYRELGGFPTGLNPMQVTGNSGGEYSVDVFAKSEKWLGIPPSPGCEKWGNREQEILGWQAYANALTAWAMQASLEFGSEIENACRWPDALTWSGLTTQQRARSRRLMAILRSAFESHARTLTLINAFSEGINLSNADVGASPELQASNGFELMRQLTLEYS